MLLCTPSSCNVSNFCCCHIFAAYLLASQILLYMARAHHDKGDHLAAKRALLKALHVAPNDIKIRFNLAFVLQVGCMDATLFCLVS
jgi:hypothetical protein